MQRNVFHNYCQWLIATCFFYNEGIFCEMLSRLQNFYVALTINDNQYVSGIGIFVCGLDM